MTRFTPASPSIDEPEFDFGCEPDHAAHITLPLPDLMKLLRAGRDVTFAYLKIHAADTPTEIAIPQHFFELFDISRLIMDQIDGVIYDDKATVVADNLRDFISLGSLNAAWLVHLEDRLKQPRSNDLYNAWHDIANIVKTNMEQDQ